MSGRGCDVMEIDLSPVQSSYVTGWGQVFLRRANQYADYRFGCGL